MSLSAVESGRASTDEHEPLIAPSARPETNDSPENTSSSEDANEDAEVLEELQVKRGLTRTDVVWRIIFVLFGALVAGTIIKTIVDGDDPDFDFGKALKKALGGGLSGAAAMVLQVLTLMPLRTIMNYQYRYGTTFRQASKKMYSEGGYGRYYQGLSAAILQGPLSRFGDTFSNTLITALLATNPVLKNLPSLLQTVFASLTAAAFRMILTPIDTVKTTLQAQGPRGWGLLKRRVKIYGVSSLWYGAVGTAAATFVGHYPWFGTYNFLDRTLPPPTTFVGKLGRQALIGFVAGAISDVVSNSLRVVKTYRQVNDTRIGYWAAAKAVIAKDGPYGLFFRGLSTRIVANGLQSIMFSILWKLFMDLWDRKTGSSGASIYSLLIDSASAQKDT